MQSRELDLQTSPRPYSSPEGRTSAARHEHPDRLLSCVLLLGPAGCSSTSQIPTIAISEGTAAYESEDFARAFRIFRGLAERGNSEAQYNVGFMYLSGQGTAVNLEEAAKWFRLAAEQGKVESQVNLANMYFNGWGVEQDYAESAIWFRKAADQGNPVAQGTLGELYDAGKGVPQSFIEAFTWYRKSAEQGNAKSQYNVGESYRYRAGRITRLFRSIQVVSKGCIAGPADRSECYGQYVSGRAGWSKQDYAEAMRWYLMAAGQGHPRAQYNLGEMYVFGRGVQRDLLLAYMWCELAVENAVDAQDRRDYSRSRASLAGYMTLEEISKATDLARSWQATIQ